VNYHGVKDLVASVLTHKTYDGSGMGISRGITSLQSKSGYFIRSMGAFGKIFLIDIWKYFDKITP
jgi:hypothetical protein